MTNLIKSEFQKINFKKYIKSIFIANIIILGIIILITYSQKALGINLISNYSIIFAIIDSLSRATFMIFSSILISNIIIKKLKNKNTTKLFPRPIDRKKLIISKIIVVFILTFLTILLSNIFLQVSFYFFNKSVNIVPNNLNIIATNILTVCLYTLTSSLISLAPMYFGIVTKSSFLTILQTFILVLIVCSYDNGFSLNSIIEIPLSLSALGILSVCLSVKHIKKLNGTRKL